jgi:hypothetical protein
MKLLVLSLFLIVFGSSAQAAKECKCHEGDSFCKLVNCSGIGSGPGTGGSNVRRPDAEKLRTKDY